MRVAYVVEWTENSPLPEAAARVPIARRHLNRESSSSSGADRINSEPAEYSLDVK